MNIKLTQTEAVNMLRDHIRRTDVFSEPIHITIDPQATDSADYGKKTVELMKLVTAILTSSVSFNGSRKIAAIKAVRAEAESQGFFVGLADAKLFVEHFIS